MYEFFRMHKRSKRNNVKLKNIVICFVCEYDFLKQFKTFLTLFDLLIFFVKNIR